MTTAPGEEARGPRPESSSITQASYALPAGGSSTQATNVAWSPSTMRLPPSITTTRGCVSRSEFAHTGRARPPHRRRRHRGSRRREEPAPAHRTGAVAVRSSVPGGLEDPLTGRRRLRAVGAVGRLAGNVTQAGRLLAASVAVVEVPLVRPAVLRVEGIERVRGGGRGSRTGPCASFLIRTTQSVEVRSVQLQPGKPRPDRREVRVGVERLPEQPLRFRAFRPRQLSIIPRWK